MEESQIISKLQSLKQIKPRENWVIFTKNEILNNNFFEYHKTSAFANILNLVLQKKFAYALAALLVVISGTFGLIKYAPTNNDNMKVAQQSPAVAADLVAVKSSVDVFKEKSKSLSKVSKSNPKELPSATKEVKDAAQKITDAVKQNPELAKSIAVDVNNNKTYLDVPGDNLNNTLEVDNLYKNLVASLIQDFDNKTLTEEQKQALDNIKELNREEKYEFALENILLLMNSGT